jgi:hypothetical protein
MKKEQRFWESWRERSQSFWYEQTIGNDDV